MEEVPGTINTSFFTNKYIDSIIDFQYSLIEEENKLSLDNDNV